MIAQSLVDSLRTGAESFARETVNSPTKNGITDGEKHWMEELSKIYLCNELHIEVPEKADEQFLKTLRQATEFGADSALVTRLVMFAAAIVCEPDFLENSSTYMSTVEHHRNHWNQQAMEAMHAYKQQRPIEDFMTEYFENPQSVPEIELSYYLTLYFRHFYRFLYSFMLFYIESHSPVYYGRSSTGV